jgi:hypothetical protein
MSAMVLWVVTDYCITPRQREHNLLNRNFQVDAIPKTGGKTSSWERVEEYRINKPSQQFKKKKKFLITPFYFLNCAMRSMLIEGEILIFLQKSDFYNSRFSFAHIVSN